MFVIILHLTHCDSMKNKFVHFKIEIEHLKIRHYKMEKIMIDFVLYLYIFLKLFVFEQKTMLDLFNTFKAQN